MARESEEEEPGPVLGTAVGWLHPYDVVDDRPTMTLPDWSTTTHKEIEGHETEVSLTAPSRSVRMTDRPSHWRTCPWLSMAAQKVEVGQDTPVSDGALRVPG